MLPQLFRSRIFHVFIEINDGLDFQERIGQLLFSGFFVRNKFKDFPHDEVIKLF